MAEIEKQKKISIVLTILLILSFFVIVILLSSSIKINDLDASTFAALIECATNIDSSLEHTENINEILNVYEDERGKIDRNTINNGITTIVVTLLFIITSLNKIINSLKSIKEIFNGKSDEKEKDTDNDLKTDLNIDELLFKIDEYQRLKGLVEQLGIKNEKDREQDEKIYRVEHIMMRIVEEFVGTLGKTSNYTNKINIDKEQLQLGMEEIKKGMEQISQVIKYDRIEENDVAKEEFMATLEQIYSALEETGTLILEMDKNVKGLSDHIENYKKCKC